MLSQHLKSCILTDVRVQVPFRVQKPSHTVKAFFIIFNSIKTARGLQNPRERV